MYFKLFKISKLLVQSEPLNSDTKKKKKKSLFFVLIDELVLTFGFLLYVYSV